MLALVSPALLEILVNEQANETNPLLMAEIGKIFLRIREGEQDLLMSEFYDTASMFLVAKAVLDAASHCFMISLKNFHFVRATFQQELL